MTPALAIFVKTAGLSPVKTRLGKDLGRDIAEQFYRLSTEAVAAVVRSTRSISPSYWAVMEREALTSEHWRSFPTIWQGNGSLGLRMHRVYAWLQSHYGRAVLIGADAPQISATLLDHAATVLACPTTTYVIGEARDGGFWLFGGNSPVPETVWLSTPYTHPRTRQTLIEALGKHRIHPLPMMTDVDESIDLRFLRAELGVLAERLPEQERLAAWLRLLLT